MKHCSNENYNEIHGVVVTYIIFYTIFSQSLMPEDLCDVWLLRCFLHGFRVKFNIYVVMCAQISSGSDSAAVNGLSF